MNGWSDTDDLGTPPPCYSPVGQRENDDLTPLFPLDPPDEQAGPLGAPADTVQLSAPTGDQLTELLQEVFSDTVPPEFWTMGDPYTKVTEEQQPSAPGGTEEIFYSDTDSNNNEVEGPYDPPRETVSPNNDSPGRQDDLKSVMEMLELKRGEVASLRDLVDELRSEINTLMNALRREAGKRQRLGCEALTARFCYDLSESLNGQAKNIISAARRGYARLAWENQKLVVDSEVDRYIEGAYAIMRK